MLRLSSIEDRVSPPVMVQKSPVATVTLRQSPVAWWRSGSFCGVRDAPAVSRCVCDGRVTSVTRLWPAGRPPTGTAWSHEWHARRHCVTGGAQSDCLAGRRFSIPSSSHMDGRRSPLSRRAVTSTESRLSRVSSHGGVRWPAELSRTDSGSSGPQSVRLAAFLSRVWGDWSLYWWWYGDVVDSVPCGGQTRWS